MTLMVAPTETQVIPTADQIAQTQQAIDDHIRSIDANPDHREGAYPYYLFHEAGQPIRGTVLMFHGFSAKPHQMWRLADYLFQNGFNVYQATLAGHSFAPPDRYWPQVDLIPEIAEPLKQKVMQDPVLQVYFANLAANPEQVDRPNPVQQKALLARMIAIEPRLLDIIQSIQLNHDPDFERYFISSHLNYVKEAIARFDELAAIPGDINLVGLSVGGAVALGLAAARPERIRRIVAYAPLLQVYGDRRQYVNLAGPLDITELGWDPNLRFPVGALTAADRFGSSFVLQEKNLAKLQQIPTFLVLTENEDAADIVTNHQFFRQIGGYDQGHRTFMYLAEDMVPHPMVDPKEVSQGMSNRFWQSLYQETFRFLTTGEIDVDNMNNLDQAADLPAVPPLH
jgi:pimeloyl-ACP methyl ester carboxylesterase